MVGYQRLDDGLWRAVPHNSRRELVDGLALRPGVDFAAHWDTFEAQLPGYQAACLAESKGRSLVALEEESAVIATGREHLVFGEGTVHVWRHGEGPSSYTRGDTFAI